MDQTDIYTIIGILFGFIVILSFWVGILYTNSKNLGLDKGFDSKTIHYINSLREINNFLQIKVDRYENLYTALSNRIIDFNIDQQISLDKNY